MLKGYYSHVCERTHFYVCERAQKIRERKAPLTTKQSAIDPDTRNKRKKTKNHDEWGQVGPRKKYDIFVCSNFYENVAILKRPKARRRNVI